MGRLINPGLGELLDRYSILTLKQLRASEPVHFHVESLQVLDLMTSHITESAGAGREWVRVIKVAVELTAINGIIWEATDEMHDSIDAGWRPRIVAAAKTLHHKNRRRAELIHILNELEAGKPLPEEKL